MSYFTRPDPGKINESRLRRNNGRPVPFLLASLLPTSPISDHVDIIINNISGASDQGQRCGPSCRLRDIQSAVSLQDPIWLRQDVPQDEMGYGKDVGEAGPTQQQGSLVRARQWQLHLFQSRGRTMVDRWAVRGGRVHCRERQRASNGERVDILERRVRPGPSGGGSRQ